MNTIYTRSKPNSLPPLTYHCEGIFHLQPTSPTSKSASASGSKRNGREFLNECNTRLSEPISLICNKFIIYFLRSKLTLFSVPILHTIQQGRRRQEEREKQQERDKNRGQIRKRNRRERERTTKRGRQREG